MPACTRRTQNKVPIKHSARQVTQDDFRKFDYILAADEANLRDLNRTKPRDATAEVRLWGSYLDNKPIEDPYYGGLVSSSDSFNPSNSRLISFYPERL